MIEKIINEWKKQKFKPVYWLEGEEEYYIDEVMKYAEHHILNEQEAGFNLTVFYGKDASMARCTKCLQALSDVCRETGGLT